MEYNDKNIQDMIEGALKDMRDTCIRCRGIGKIKYEVLSHAASCFQGQQFIVKDCPDCKGSGIVLRRRHYEQLTKKAQLLEDSVYYIEQQEGLRTIRPAEREDKESYIRT